MKYRPSEVRYGLFQSSFLGDFDVLGHDGELVVHPLDQPHAILEFLTAASAAQDRHHHSALETSHEGVPAFLATPSLSAQAALFQQFIGVLEETDPADQFPILADLPRSDQVLPGGGDLAEKGYFEALGGQPGYIDRRGHIPSQPVRIDKDGIRQAHLLGVPRHQPHEDSDIGLPILIGKVETAEIAIGPLLEDETAEVVGDSRGDVVGGGDQQRKKCLFQGQQGLLFWIEVQPGPADAVVRWSGEEVEGGDSDEVFLDDLVGGVEGQQFADAGYRVRTAILVPLDQRPRLETEDGPFFGSDVGQRHLPQHALPIGTLRRGQFHVDRMREDCPWIQRPVILQCCQGLRAQSAVSNEDLWVIVQRPQVEDGLVEESGIVAQVRLALRQGLGGDCVQLFEGEGGKDATGFLGRGGQGFQGMRFIVARHEDYLYNESIQLIKQTHPNQRGQPSLPSFCSLSLFL